jgi:hypothetical protein
LKSRTGFQHFAFQRFSFQPMALPESWHIRSRARACAATERPFEDGEAIVTALFPDPESSGYLRKDFALEAWQARGDDDEKPFSFWKAAFHVTPVDEKPNAFKKESPEDLLRRLVDEEEDHTENVRYILAVMLERKKVLRETDTQRTPSGIIRVYEHRKLGDVFIVRDPNLPLDQIDQVQQEIFELLESGGRQPEPEALEESIPTEESSPGTAASDPDPGAAATESQAADRDEVAEVGEDDEGMEEEDVEEEDVEEEDVEEEDVEEEDVEEEDVDVPSATPTGRS